MQKNIIIYLLVISAACFSVFATPEQEKFKLAESYEKVGDMKNASRLFLELYTLNKHNDKNFDAVVRTYKAQSLFSELLPIIEDNMKIRQISSVYALYGETLWKLGKPNEANKAWNDALELNPENDKCYSDVANSQIGCKQYEKAIATLLKARNTLKVKNIYADELSQLYTMTGNYKLASEEVLALYETSRNISVAQGRITAFLGNKEAKEYISSQLSERSGSSNDPEYKKLYAWFLRGMGKHEEAFEVYKKIDAMQNTRGMEILNFANTSQKDGQYDIAIKAYEYIIDRGKTSPYVMNALFGIARSLELKSQTKNKITKEVVLGIIERYRTIAKDFAMTPTADDALFRMANLYSEQLQDFTSAKKVLNELIAKSPKKPITASALNLLGDIYFMEDNLSEAENCYKKIAVTYKPYAPNEYNSALYKLTELEYFSGEIDSSQVHFGLLSLNSGTDIANDAFEKVVIMEDNKTLTLALQVFAKAEQFEKQKKFDEAIAKYNETISTADGSDLAERSFLKIARIEFNLNRYLDCRKTCDSLMSKYPKTIYGDYAAYFVGNCYMAENNKEQALKIFTEYLAKYPRSIYLDEIRVKIRILRNEKL